ncbi:MAG: V-type ATPase subunit [Clostridiales bacterium]|nr:V-type ATPase subunit [Clostridiales bacterium]
MPQTSINYACGRIGVLRRNALGAAQLERLMATHTYEEAFRTLSDIGFINAEQGDFQTAADAHVQSACELVVAITPEPDVTNCFLLRYDIHNLKILMKSRFLGQAPDFLSSCGTLNVEMLKNAITDQRYHQLPPIFKTAMDELEASLAKEFDPMLIDVVLDKAMYRQIAEQLKNTKHKNVKHYFIAKVDMQNYIMLLRVKSMGKDIDFFKNLFLPCGSIKLELYAQAFDDEAKLSELLKSYGKKVHQAATVAASNHKKLPLMEKTADDYLYKLFGNTKYQSASLDMIIAYLLQTQRESTDVRLIMAGKLNGFTSEELAERVRELHG